MPHTLIRSPLQPEAAATVATPIGIATELAQRLAASANARDQAGGHAARERAWIRDSGLLTLSIPTEFGGQGAAWPVVYQVIRILARADSALAHVFAFHHLQLASITLYGSAQQQRRLLTQTVEQRLFWGNALNPLDKRIVASEAPDGYTLNGIKSFSSGSVGSDWLTVSAWHEASQGALIGVVQTGAAVGLSRRSEALLDPTFQALRALPSLAWVPLLLLWLGIDKAPKLVLIAIGAFFPVYMGVASGIRGVDRKLIEVGRLYRLSCMTLARRVLLPAALPSILTGLRNGLSLAWMFMAAAELIAASKGRGYLLSDGRETSRADIVLLSA